MDRRINNSRMVEGWGVNGKQADRQASMRTSRQYVFQPSHCLFPGCGEAEAGRQFSGPAAH